MGTNTAVSTGSADLPTLSQIRQRTTELLRLAQQPQPRVPQPPAPAPAPPWTPVPRCYPQLPSVDYPELDHAALYGLAGRALRTFAPHTEAHPASLLLQLLAVFGNLLGPGPHCRVGAARHSLNLFTVLVGDSSKARKGTSWAQIARLIEQVDQPWLAARVTAARLTPRGLASAMSAAAPSSDRRLLALSEEFATVLATVSHRSGNLSPLLRSAWDNGCLPPLDLLRPAVETHLSLVAHITRQELDRHLPRTETRNGFANRCLWAFVHRGSCLPHGGNLADSDLASLAHEIRRALNWANAAPEILFERDQAARELWEQHYPALSQLHPGLHGAATSRAEAQVLRLSAIYAALDATSVIAVPHLKAALALWDYCNQSAAILFGLSTGDPVADRIREAVESSPAGLSKNQISRLFHGHVEAIRIDAALETLVSMGVLGAQPASTGGRPSTLWSLNEEDPQTLQEENDQPETESPSFAE